MFRILTGRFRHMKFRTKILCVTGAVTLIPILILFVFFWQQISTLQERELHNTDLAFEQNVYTLNQLMDSVITNTIQICTNKEVSSFFSLRSAPKDIVLKYVTGVRPYITYCQEAVSPNVKALRFYTKNQDMFSNIAVHNVIKSDDDALFDRVSEAMGDNSLVVLLLDEGRSYYSIEYSSENTLSVFSMVNAPASNRTMLECELSFANFFQTLKFSTNDFETTGYTLYHQSGKVLFSSDPAWAEEVSGNILPEVLGGGEFRRQRFSYEGKTFLVNAAPVSSINCVLVSHSDLGVVFKPVQDYQLVVLAAIILCVICCCLLAAALVNSLLRRSRIINDAILQIQGGNFDISVPVEGSDFIDQVAGNLNGMAAQIKDLIHNNYENQLEIKDLQIRMLSQQISPHFLYNTLECLRMRAVLEDNTETAQALLSLGRLLRYYANYAAETGSVSTELEVAQDYVNIISLMEERGCALECHVPRELSSRSVPRFMLQPIIENSIKHADLPQGTAIRISITVQEKGGTLRFNVTDNGRGVPPEQAVEIQQQLLSSSVYSGTSIGLYNTNARIRLLYGDDYGILFSSIHGVGTSVTICIPSDPLKKEDAL